MDHSPIRATVAKLHCMPDRTSTEEPQIPAFAAQFGIASLVGVGLAIAGAFGTDAMGLGWRFLYWIGGLALAGLALRLLALPMQSVCRLIGIAPHWSFLLAVPLLGVLVVLTLTLSGAAAVNATTLFWQNVGLGAALFALFGVLHWIGAKRTARSSPPDTQLRPVPPADTPLHEHLSPGFGPIQALTVEDHYVTVIGEEHRAMLLMNLSEAIEGLGHAEGLRVHRSWWVARGAMDRLERDGRNSRLKLTDGSHVPVSRANVAKVKALLGD